MKENVKSTSDLSFRLTGLLFFIIYPLQTTAIFPEQTGLARNVSVGFMVSAFLFLNYRFFKDLKKIFTVTQSLKDAYIEFVWVFVAGLINIILFASLYHMYGVNNGSTLVKGDWAISIYFSVVTWTTLGYGDFSPVKELRLVAASEAMMGYIYMALLVGLFLSLSQQTLKLRQEQ